MPAMERRTRSKRERRESAALIQGQLIDQEVQLMESNEELASFFNLEEDEGDDCARECTTRQHVEDPAPTDEDAGSCYDPDEWRPLDYAMGPEGRAMLREMLGEEGKDLLTPESPFL